MADQATVASPLCSRPHDTSLASSLQNTWIPCSGHNLRTNDFECPGPSFESQDACIDFPIRPVPTIRSVFYIKTRTNGRPL